MFDEDDGAEEEEEVEDPLLVISSFSSLSFSTSSLFFLPEMDPRASFFLNSEFRCVLRRVPVVPCPLVFASSLYSAMVWKRHVSPK